MPEARAEVVTLAKVSVIWADDASPLVSMSLKAWLLIGSAATLGALSPPVETVSAALDDPALANRAGAPELRMLEGLEDGATFADVSLLLISPDGTAAAPGEFVASR